MKRRMVSADEYDAYTKWRKVLCYLQRPGAVKAIKRRTHKRERREGKVEAQGQDLGVEPFNLKADRGHRWEGERCLNCGWNKYDDYPLTCQEFAKRLDRQEGS